MLATKKFIAITANNDQLFAVDQDGKVWTRDALELSEPWQSVTDQADENN